MEIRCSCTILVANQALIHQRHLVIIIIINNLYIFHSINQLIVRSRLHYTSVAIVRIGKHSTTIQFRYCSWWQQVTPGTEQQFLGEEEIFRSLFFCCVKNQIPTKMTSITDKVQIQHGADFTFICKKVPFAISCTSQLPYHI